MCGGVSLCESFFTSMWNLNSQRTRYIKASLYIFHQRSWFGFTERFCLQVWSLTPSVSWETSRSRWRRTWRWGPTQTHNFKSLSRNNHEPQFSGALVTWQMSKSHDQNTVWIWTFTWPAEVPRLLSLFAEVCQRSTGGVNLPINFLVPLLHSPI